MGRAAAVAGVVGAVAFLVGCGTTTDGTTTDGAAGPDRVAAPEGLSASVDQARAQRSGRQVFVRLVDDAGLDLTVLGARLSSDRFDAVTWTGEERTGREADLEVDLPVGRCGTGSQVDVTLTYRRGDGPVRVSRLTAADRYGALGLLLDRDCALRTLEEAATVDVGEPRVVGRGRESVLEVPFALLPTGRGGGVVLAGLEDTVLFRQVRGSASAASGTRVRVGPGEPAARLLLRVVPGRCDPHALAEDKVGTLFPMRVLADGVPPEAGAYLPLDDATRAALRRFVPVHCGW